MINKIVISVFEDGWDVCVCVGGGAHHKNQLNVLPFSNTETDILHYNIL